jgi:putative colanic acid biosynthesis acetyltransferase WcaF
MTQTQPTQNTKVFQALDRTAKAPYPRSYYFRRAAWGVVWRTIFRLPRAWGLRRSLLRAFGAKVADRVVIYSDAEIFHPWLLEIGYHSVLSAGAVIYNLGPVTIGAHSVISQGAYVCAGTHDYTKSDLPLERPTITIGSGVWIAAQAFIGPGVSIGDNSVVGARAVVTKDVPAGVVAAGNPARVIKPRPMADAGHERERP